MSSKYVCNWIKCGRHFESIAMLATHIAGTHATAEDDGLYYCRWHTCTRIERGFNARYKMLVHVRTHTKERPHHCPLCGKSFSRAENLKIHIRSHSGEKPYTCPHVGCNKSYSNSSDRFKHMRTHAMDKPYKCKVPGCVKRYTDPSSLRKHVKTFKHSIQLLENPTANRINQTLYNGPLNSVTPPLTEYFPRDDFICKCYCVPPAIPQHLNEKYYLMNKANRLMTDIYWDVEVDGEYQTMQYRQDEAHYKMHADEEQVEFIVKEEIKLEMPLDLRVQRQ